MNDLYSKKILISIFYDHVFMSIILVYEFLDSLFEIFYLKAIVREGLLVYVKIAFDYLLIFYVDFLLIIGNLCLMFCHLVFIILFNFLIVIFAIFLISSLGQL